MKDDLISRRVALDALANNMPSLTTPDGSGLLDHDIQVTDEAYVDCMQIIHELPSAQPGEDIRAVCGECDAWNRYKNYPQPGWTTDVNDILAYLDGVVHPLVSPENWNVYSELYDMVSGLLKPREGEPNE